MCLWVLAGIGLKSGASTGITSLVLLFSLIMPILGIAQDGLLPGPWHWMIQGILSWGGRSHRTRTTVNPQHLCGPKKECPMTKVIRQYPDLAGKTAVVTGGSSAIGGAICRQLAAMRTVPIKPLSNSSGTPRRASSGHRTSLRPLPEAAEIRRRSRKSTNRNGVSWWMRIALPPF